MSEDFNPPPKRVQVAIGLDVVRHFLKLPIGVFVDGVIQDDDDRLRNVVRFVLSGEDLPDHEEGFFPAAAKLHYVETGQTEAVLEAQLIILTEKNTPASL